MTARKMAGIDCIDPEIGALLVQYGLGTLDETDCERFERHVLECRACQEELDSAAAALDLMHEQRSAFQRKALNVNEDFDSLLARRGHLVKVRVGMEQGSQTSGRDAPNRINWFRWLFLPAVGVAAALFLIFQSMPPGAPEVAETKDKLNTRRIQEFRGNPATLIGVLGISRSPGSDSALVDLLRLYESGNLNAVLKQTSDIMKQGQDRYSVQMLRGGAFLIEMPDSAYACFMRAHGLALTEEQRNDASIFAARAAASSGDYGTARGILSQFTVSGSNRRTFAETWIPFLDSLIVDQQTP